MSAPFTRGQRLAAEAREAAEVRAYQTDPDVVALRVEKARTVTELFIWSGMILGLLFTMTNVQQFTAHTIHARQGDLEWWAAWLLDPTVSCVLLGILLAERHTSRWQVPVSEWTRVAKWALLAATYTMNCWESYAAGSAAGIVLHSVPPLVVFMGAEAVTDLQDKLTECVHKAHAHAAQRAERKAKEQASGSVAQLGGIVSPATITPGKFLGVSAPEIGPGKFPSPIPVRPTVPDRSDAPGKVSQGLPSDLSDFTPAVGSADRSGAAERTVPADRSANRSADRSEPVRPSSARTERAGSGPVRNGKPRTDAELARAVRRLAEQNGGPPTTYQVRQLGVGAERARRLLAELAATTTTNGSAPKGGTR